jgi:hypothetical protein
MLGHGGAFGPALLAGMIVECGAADFMQRADFGDGDEVGGIGLRNRGPVAIRVNWPADGDTLW